MLKKHSFQKMLLFPFSIIHYVLLFVAIFLLSGEQSFAVPLKSIILYDVPFFSQAPTFQWNDERFASACEEASALMALAWAGVRPFPKTRETQAKAILDFVAFENEQYGVYYDTSLQDIARFTRAYSDYDGFTIKKNILWQDILEGLENGFIVIVPVDGKILKNPNYKGAGPETHMLVVRGYDYATQEFITNDSGTRRGQGYRYHRRVLFDAIRDYKTGKHEKGRPRTKSMLLVQKTIVEEN